MGNRSKAPIRRERESDSMEAIKPLVVLVLLGTILYGAYSVVQKGPGTGGQAAVHPQATEAPPFAAPPVAAPQIEMPPPQAAQQPPVEAQAVAAPVFQPAATAQPTVVSAATPPAAPIVAAAAPVVAAGIAAAVPPATAATPALSADAAPTYLAAQSAPPPVADAAIAGPALQSPQPPAVLAADTRSAATPPPSAAFASAWADAHVKLAAGRYAEALAVLSVWLDDPSLGLEESQRLEELLGQLAGTVIYSRQDLLLPPHIVAPDETLPSIAAKLSVPWQLLAKINGIEDPAVLVVGEPLKVLSGPFDAVVSVSRRRLSLQVGGNYAGSFPVVVGRQVEERVGSSLAVVEVRRGGEPTRQPAATQVSFPGPADQGLSIALGEGLTIEAVDDPNALGDAAPSSSLVISARDLRELVDILGPGSHVLVRR
jgi:hypothetical protein